MEFVIIKQIKDIKLFKQSIYDGKVFILRKNIQIIDLNNYVLKKFKSFFKIDANDFIYNDKAKEINEVSCQLSKNIKESKVLLKKFAVFLGHLKFNINEILSDKITFRYSPKIIQKLKVC